MTKEIWTFKYEPKTLDNMILHDETRKNLEYALENVPNLLLTGPPGCGKGTFVNVLKNHTKYDFYKINASDENSIDVMRTKIKTFATSLGMTDYKIMFLNEADALTSGQSGAQKMLRELIEETQHLTRFILACNYSEYIIKEIKSRCYIVDFLPPSGKDVYNRCISILKSENISKINKKSLLEIVKKSFPDFRNTIVNLQASIIDGKLESAYISEVESFYKKIFEHTKKKELNEVRSILRTHAIDYVGLYQYFFENVNELNNVADAIILIAEHLNRNSISAIKEINFMHMVMLMIQKGII